MFDTYESVLDHTICESDLPATFMGIDIPEGSISDPEFAVLHLSSIQGCDSTITINLSITPSVHTYTDTSLCYGSIYEFGDLMITEPGTYQQVLESFTGCDSIVHIDVSFSPAPVIETTVLTECGEVEYEGRVYTETTSFSDTFHYELSGCDSLIRIADIRILLSQQETIQAEICKGEVYEFNGRQFTETITVTDTFIFYNGCDSMITLQLTVHPLPPVDLEFGQESNLFCIFDTISLEGKGSSIIYEYYNTFDDRLGEGNKIWVMLSQPENQYYVVGTDDNGCRDTSQVTVYANSCCDMLVPNAFSPNGDGLNDEFGPVTEGHPLKYRMEIYNRYGQRVHVSHSPDNKWGGKYENGDHADAGIYYYLITGQCYDGTPLYFRGDLHLVK